MRWTPREFEIEDLARLVLRLVLGGVFIAHGRWFYCYEADIVALRGEHPGLISSERYLRTHGWENAQPAA